MFVKILTTENYITYEQNSYSILNVDNNLHYHFIHIYQKGYIKKVTIRKIIKNLR